MTQHPTAPLLAANKALDEITAIAATHQPPDKFTHDRLERVVKSSIPVDAAFSYSTLGALEAVSGNEELMDTGAYKDLIKAATLQKSAGIADEEVMQLVQIACDFLRSKQVHFVDQELIADEEDEGFLSLTINLNLTNEEIWNFNRQLFEIMLDKVPNQSPHLSVRFGRSHAA